MARVWVSDRTREPRPLNTRAALRAGAEDADRLARPAPVRRGGNVSIWPGRSQARSQGSITRTQRLPRRRAAPSAYPAVVVLLHDAPTRESAARQRCLELTLAPLVGADERLGEQWADADARICGPARLCSGARACRARLSQYESGSPNARCDSPLSRMLRASSAMLHATGPTERATCSIGRFPAPREIARWPDASASASAPGS